MGPLQFEQKEYITDVENDTYWHDELFLYRYVVPLLDNANVMTHGIGAIASHSDILPPSIKIGRPYQIQQVDPSASVGCQFRNFATESTVWRDTSPMDWVLRETSLESIATDSKQIPFWNDVQPTKDFARKVHGIEYRYLNHSNKTGEMTLQAYMDHWNSGALYQVRKQMTASPRSNELWYKRNSVAIQKLLSQMKQMYESSHGQAFSSSELIINGSDVSEILSTLF